jgi:hypothetical protein
MARAPELCTTLSACRSNRLVVVVVVVENRRWYDEMRQWSNSCPKHMCFLWWRELIKCQRSPQHACPLPAILERRCYRRWYEQCWRLISSGQNTIWFLWRRELIKRRHSSQHCPLVVSNQSTCCCWKIDSDMASANVHTILAQTP